MPVIAIAPTTISPVALVPPFFICFVLVVPMLPVTIFMVVADKYLVIKMTPEMIKLSSVI